MLARRAGGEWGCDGRTVCGGERLCDRDAEVVEERDGERGAGERADEQRVAAAQLLHRVEGVLEVVGRDGEALDAGGEVEDDEERHRDEHAEDALEADGEERRNILRRDEQFLHAELHGDHHLPRGARAELGGQGGHSPGEGGGLPARGR